MRVAGPAGPPRQREAAPSSGGPDLPPDPDWGGGEGEWILLTTAENSVIAHLIEGRLSGEGISCVLDHFNPSPGAWLKPFGDPLAPVKIYVRRRYLAAASIVLHEIGHHPPDPLQEGPPLVRTLWWVTILMIVVLTLISLFQIYSAQAGDAPGAPQGRSLTFVAS